MARGNTGLDSNDYDSYLSSKGKDNKSARRELEQRHKEKRNAHSADGVGWHFGIGDTPVKVTSREELKSELNKRGLMLRDDVKKELK